MTGSHKQPAASPVPHPGEVLLDWILEHGQTQSWMANSLGVSLKHINHIIRGRSLYSERIALRLGEITDKPASWWAEARTSYRLYELSTKKKDKGQ